VNPRHPVERPPLVRHRILLVVVTLTGLAIVARTSLMETRSQHQTSGGSWDASSSHCPSVPVPRTRLSRTHSEEGAGAPPPQGWSDLTYEQLAQLRQPLIIHGPTSIVHQWSAWSSDLLKVDALIQRLPDLPVYAADAPAFATFHADKPLERLSGLDKRAFEKSSTRVRSECVLLADDASSASLNCSTEERYHYFSLRLSSMPADFLGSIQPLAPLLLSPRGNSQANLWLGRRGIITSSHFDLQYNFFFQFEGAKTFELYPPTSKLRLYPNTHPHQAHVFPAPHEASDAGQCESGETKSNEKQLKRYVAKLKRGDMLIVPPLWLHHVRTDSRSVSLNVWSDAPEYERMEDIYSLPVPLEADWSFEDRVLSTMYYLRRLTVGVLYQGETTLQLSHGRKAEQLKTKMFAKYVNEWLRGQRFHDGIMTILKQHMLPFSPSESSDFTSLTSRTCLGGIHPTSLRAAERFQTPEHEVSRWKRGLEPAIDAFEKIREVAKVRDPTGASAATDDSAADPISSQHEAILSILLTNYVEWILWAMLGDKGMVWFIEHCLAES
jgi:hypothetical protein